MQAVLAQNGWNRPRGGLALRLAAIAGARRAELAALRWDDVHGGELTIDSAIEVLTLSDGKPELRDATTKRPMFAL